jgi:hypothetical protein
MLIVQDQVWNTVTVNRSSGKATWYFIDEFHLLLKETQTAAYSAEIWKRFRKWGGIPTGATQNVKDLLSSPEIEKHPEKTVTLSICSTKPPVDRKILAERLDISPQQIAYVTKLRTGRGAFVLRNVILPFVDKFPQDTELYRIMTTRAQ